MAAVIAATCSAFVEKSNNDCTTQTRYYKISTPWGSYYCYAGEAGVDYMCDFYPGNTCTWVRPDFSGGGLVECEEGLYTRVYDGW